MFGIPICTYNQRGNNKRKKLGDFKVVKIRVDTVCYGSRSQVSSGGKSRSGKNAAPR
jgi:hypothetical protein